MLSYYRPLSLEDFYGNEEVKCRARGVSCRPRVVLITGGRGVGKTTFARLLATMFSSSSEVERCRFLVTGNDLITEDISTLTNVKLDEVKDDNKIYIVDNVDYLSKEEQLGLSCNIDKLCGSMFILVSGGGTSCLSQGLLGAVQHEFNIKPPSTEEQVRLLRQFYTERYVLSNIDIDSIDTIVNILKLLRGMGNDIDFESLVDSGCVRLSLFNLRNYKGDNCCL